MRGKVDSAERIWAEFFGVANFRKIARKFLGEFFGNFFPKIFGLVSPELQAPLKNLPRTSCPKLSAVIQPQIF